MDCQMSVGLESIQLAVELIKLHEGFRDKPYECSAGKITIGWGHNLTDCGMPVRLLEDLLMIDVDKALCAAREVCPAFERLDPVRRAVLIDMAFNLGKAGLAGFKNTLRMIEEERYSDAAKNMLMSRWARQVGRRADRLAKMMETGKVEA